MSTPPTLALLTLSPLPLSDLPSSSDAASFEEFKSSLISEAHTILNHPEWSEPKEWHNGKVTTRVLRDGAVVHLPRESDALLNGDGEKKEPVKEKKRSFWGGGGNDKSEKEKEKERDGSIQWHKRTTYHPITDSSGGEQGWGYEVYWEALGEKHIEKEVEYVHSLSKIHEVDPEGTGVWLKLYSLPFPTTNRSFLSYVLVLDTTVSPSPPTSSQPDTATTPIPLRSFLVFSLPIIAPSNPINNIDKSYVRGRYVAVEEISEIYVDSSGSELPSSSTAPPEGATKTIRWRCASQSDAGGSIPLRIAEGAMPSSLASHVPAFYEWLSKRYGTGKDKKERPEKETHHWYTNVEGVKILRRRGSLKGVSH